MQIPTGMLIFFALVLGFGGSRTPLNACQVLSARDVAAVQGARFKSTKLKESGNREMQVSQCFYAMKGETIVRVSVGGDAPQEQKIERAKKLAARALRKL